MEEYPGQIEDLREKMAGYLAESQEWCKRAAHAESQLHTRDTALAAARVALSLTAGISAVRSDKKLDHQIKEAKEASVSAIEQIDAAGLPEKLG